MVTSRLIGKIRYRVPPNQACQPLIELMLEKLSPSLLVRVACVCCHETKCPLFTLVMMGG